MSPAIFQTAPRNPVAPSPEDREGLREVVKRYLEVAQNPDQAAKRELWRKFHAHEPGPVPVVGSAASFYIWMKRMLEPGLRCQDPFLRWKEYELRCRIFHSSIGDDTVFVPWLTLPATKIFPSGHKWGVALHQEMDGETNARHQEYPLKSADDFVKVRPAPHRIDEQATARQLGLLQDAVGDLIPIDVDRTPWCNSGFNADLATDLGYLRGIQPFMEDMYEEPERLHELLSTMRDGVLAAQDAAEQAGDLGLTGFTPQHPMPYDREVEEPRPNAHGQNRKDLWYFCAAQEFIGVSPKFHEAFMLDYQLPILSKYKKVHYGCCEDLTKKIDMLRKVPNLEIISVTPSANVRACAEQIGGDYLISWRPNPTDMVCSTWDEDRIRRITTEAKDAMKACRFCVHLKDVETVCGEPQRLGKWVGMTRALLG